MKIFLTNDDGYSSPGISILYSKLVDCGHDVIIVAPESDCSGKSHSISMYHPIRIYAVNEHTYFVSSTPADSVRLGLHYLANAFQPDLLISGINLGANIANDVLYSGTVAAAREGALHGLFSIAVSLCANDDYKELPSAARSVCDLVDTLQSSDVDIMQSPALLNVNIPDISYDHLADFQITHLGAIFSYPRLKEQVNPNNYKVFWQNFDTCDAFDPNDNGSDQWVISNSHNISITPLNIFNTQYGKIDVLKNIFSKKNV